MGKPHTTKKRLQTPNSMTSEAGLAAEASLCASEAPANSPLIPIQNLPRLVLSAVKKSQTPHPIRRRRRRDKSPRDSPQRKRNQQIANRSGFPVGLFEPRLIETIF